MMAAMTPKAKDLVMTYPRTPLPPPFRDGGLPAELWAQTWDAVHVQIAAEMAQAELQVQDFMASMPSMNPLSMFKGLFSRGPRGARMARMGEAMAAAGNTQRTWLA